MLSMNNETTFESTIRVQTHRKFLNIGKIPRKNNNRAIIQLKIDNIFFD